MLVGSLDASVVAVGDDVGIITGVTEGALI